MGRRRTRPEEDVEIGATASPAVGALGATSDVIDSVAIGKVVSEEIKVVGAREEDEVLSTELRSLPVKDNCRLRADVSCRAHMLILEFLVRSSQN